VLEFVLVLEIAIVLLLGKRLTNYTADDVGGVADPFRLAQAAGVSSAVWLIGRSASPGRTERR
jgi:hypothetical protein